MTKDQEITRYREALEKISEEWTTSWRAKELAREALSESTASPQGVEPKEMGKSSEVLTQEKTPRRKWEEGVTEAWDKRGMRIYEIHRSGVGELLGSFYPNSASATEYKPEDLYLDPPTPSSSTPVTSPPSEEKHQKGELPVSHAEKGSEGVNRKRCIVRGCTNLTHQGDFIGELCVPCHEHLTSGIVGPTTSFLGKLQQENDELRGRLDKALYELGNCDKVVEDLDQVMLFRTRVIQAIEDYREVYTKGLVKADVGILLKRIKTIPTEMSKPQTTLSCGDSVTSPKSPPSIAAPKDEGRKA